MTEIQQGGPAVERGYRPRDIATTTLPLPPCGCGKPSIMKLVTRETRGGVRRDDDPIVGERFCCEACGYALIDDQARRFAS